MNNIDKTYQDLLSDILNNGVTKSDRTGTGTKSVFGRQIRHNMKDGFPLLTTKKMYFKGIVTEMIWFLRGDTNIKYLVDNDCHIWDGDAYKNYITSIKDDENTMYPKFLDELEYDVSDEWSTGGPAWFRIKVMSKEEFINKIKTDDKFAKKWGDLGPIYGKQWRNWKFTDKFTNGEQIAYANGKIDQIKNLINDLNKNPDSRRIMVNAWNVGEVDHMVLPPCHYGFQVWTRDLTEREIVEYYYKNHRPNEKYKFEGLSVFYFREDLNMWIEHSGSDIHLTMKPLCPKKAISLMWNQRSVDTFLGLPFNIASYALLLEIIGKMTNMLPDELIGSLGDTHIYLNHYDQVLEQIGRELTLEERIDLVKTPFPKDDFIKYKNEETEKELKEQLNKINVPLYTRQPYPLPKINFTEGLNDVFLKFRGDYKDTFKGIELGHDYGYLDQVDSVFNYMTPLDFKIVGYQSHPSIKAPLSN